MRCTREDTTWLFGQINSISISIGATLQQVQDQSEMARKWQKEAQPRSKIILSQEISRSYHIGKDQGQSRARQFR